MRYSEEQKAAIRAALEAAERTLAEPGPEAADWPPCETRSQKWRREADEQAARFAAERAAAQPLSDYEAARLEARLAAQIGAELGEHRGLLADSLAAVREVIEAFEQKVAALEQKVSELTAELGSMRADATIEKAHNKVLDLPALPLRKRA